ncbi:MAG: DUF971 domain-containing protein [Deltaproteobacteria bacterium]|nr:DUF971 domain-containing protein [Deltaproteobacteria bacterium]
MSKQPAIAAPAARLKQQLLVRRIAQLDRYTLGIEWIDGHRSHWRLSTLRRKCPCASCIDEWTGEPILKADDVDDDILASVVESIGRYALRVHFSDGHNTGIYTFAFLREIDEAAR